LKKSLLQKIICLENINLLLKRKEEEQGDGGVGEEVEEGNGGVVWGEGEEGDEG